MGIREVIPSQRKWITYSFLVCCTYICMTSLPCNPGLENSLSSTSTPHWCKRKNEREKQGRDMKGTMQNDIKDTEQSWHLCLNHWRSNFKISLEDRVTPHLASPHPKKHHIRNIELDFFSVFVFTITAPQAVQGQISQVKKNY